MCVRPHLDTTCTPTTEEAQCQLALSREGTVFSCQPHTTDTGQGKHQISSPVAQYRTLGPGDWEG